MSLFTTFYWSSELTFQINSPLEELLECESLSLSHSFNISAAVLGLLSCSHSGEVGDVGESWNDVLIISDAGPGVILFYSAFAQHSKYQYINPFFTWSSTLSFVLLQTMKYYKFKIQHQTLSNGKFFMFV